MQNNLIYDKVWQYKLKNIDMNLETIKISSVNMEERKELGISAGDTVRVWVKIEEKGKTRTQAFEGLVLARKHGDEAGATFTVRKVASGVGVERIFPLYSPMIDKIEIIKRARVRRSKLYFIREKVAREIRRQMRKMKMMDLSTKSEIGEANRKIKEEEQVKIDEQVYSDASSSAKAMDDKKAVEDMKVMEDKKIEDEKEKKAEIEQEVEEVKEIEKETA